MVKLFAIPFVIVILLVVTAAPWDAAAQQFSLPAPLALRATPSSPSPGKKVAIEASTPTFDRNTAFFEWTIDGKTRADLSGLGKNIITLTAGRLGTATRVTVAITRAKPPELTASLTIPVSDLALAWFAETYVPPWYRGKALPVARSVVNVVAVPQVIVGGRTLGNNELIYRWSVDAEKDALVGVGERVFRLRTADFPGTERSVHVTVEDIDKKVRKEANLFLTSSVPRAVAYTVSPLGGVETRTALSIFTNAKPGLLDFHVEPFFFPVKSRKELQYQWSVEGTPAQGTPKNPHLLTLDTNRWPRGRETIIPISVTVDDLEQIISAAVKSFSVRLQ